MTCSLTTKQQKEFKKAGKGLRVFAAADGNGPRVTASFGVAAVDPTDEGAVKTALEAADLAVHEAKNQGRDRVEVAV